MENATSFTGKNFWFPIFFIALISLAQCTSIAANSITLLLTAGMHSDTVPRVHKSLETASREASRHQLGPIVTCKDNVVIALDAAGLANVLPQYVLKDDYRYEKYTVEVFQKGRFGNQINCESIGHSLTYKVTDISTGNGCWGNILVEDTIAPSIICEDIFLTNPLQNYSPDYLLNELGIAAGYPISNDNCKNYVLTFSDEIYTFSREIQQQKLAGSNNLLYRRIWTTNDGDWNSSSCSQFIYLGPQPLFDARFPTNTTQDLQNPFSRPFTADINPGFSELQIFDKKKSFNQYSKPAVHKQALSNSQVIVNKKPQKE